MANTGAPYQNLQAVKYLCTVTGSISAPFLRGKSHQLQALGNDRGQLLRASSIGKEGNLRSSLSSIFCRLFRFHLMVLSWGGLTWGPHVTVAEASCPLETPECGGSSSG